MTAIRGVTDLDGKRFAEWCDKTAIGLDFTSEPTLKYLFFLVAKWLTESLEGEEALRHLNATPRQRALEFESQVGKEEEYR